MTQINDRSKLKLEMSKSGFLDLFSCPVEQYVKLLSFSPRAFIVQEGVMPSHLFYLISGRTKLYTMLANGKVALIDFFVGPCFIGEMELVGNTDHICAVQAIEPCMCFSLPLEPCKKMLLNDAVFLRNICLYLSRKNARNIDVLTKNRAFALENRLAGFILLSSTEGLYEEKHEHVADYLGVSYRHLLYVLADFVKKGFIEKEGRSYRILNKEALMRLVKVVEPDMNLLE